MKRLPIIILLILASNLVYAALPPSMILNVSYEREKIQDKVFYVEYLKCRGAEYESHETIIPKLNIMEYDQDKDCYWKPPKWEYRWNDCLNSKCETFSTDNYLNKVAVYIPGLNKIFITDAVDIEADKNYYNIELFADGSSHISKTNYIDTSDMYKGFDEDNKTSSENNYLLGWSIILLFVLFAGLIVWLIIRIIKPKK